MGHSSMAAAAPAVQEQDALLPAADVFASSSCNGRLITVLFSGTQLLPQIGDADLRQSAAVVALRQLQQIVLTLLRVVKRLHRGRGRAQQQPRTLRRRSGILPHPVHGNKGRFSDS